MIDTHCHLTYEPLMQQAEAVIDRAHQAGVHKMISVGTTPTDAQAAVGLTKRFEGIYATVGVHPHYAQQWQDEKQITDVIHELASDPKVVAVGEMGLDRHYSDPPIEQQRRVFACQLQAAKGLNKPIVIHNREATDDVLAMIKDSAIPGDRFVFHCFTGEQAELEAILAMGAMVGFTGIVTFPSARSVAQCATHVPLDRLLIETDSPYLTPAPHRKVRPNEPCYVPYVAGFLAKLRGMDEAELIRVVDDNAVRFFGLD